MSDSLSGGPRRWLAAVLADRLAEHGDSGTDADVGWQHVPWVALFGGDGALQRCFDRLCRTGVPPQAAATYTCGWYASWVANVVGVGLAGASAGLCLDPESLVWRVHPDGWADSVAAVPRLVLLAEGHEWCGLGDDAVRVEVAADADVVGRPVRALVDVVRPIVEACHGLTKVGAAGLWNEVADALGCVMAYQDVIEPTPARVALLERAVRTPGVPWRARPALWFEDTPSGPVHVVRKGGCCLAYTERREPANSDDAGLDDDELDDDDRADLARFPEPPDAPMYCSTCSFRDEREVAERQIFWHERRRRSPQPTT